MAFLCALPMVALLYIAHPILIGTHGNPEPGKGEIIENFSFVNIDILNHDEPQLNYQGVLKTTRKWN